MVTDAIIYGINLFVNRIFKKTPPAFFAAFSGERVSGKQGKCIDTCDFRAAKMLVGVPPNPMDFWPVWPEAPLSAALSLTAPGPYFPARLSGRADDPHRL